MIVGLSLYKSMAWEMKQQPDFKYTSDLKVSFSMFKLEKLRYNTVLIKMLCQCRIILNSSLQPIIPKLNRHMPIVLYHFLRRIKFLFGDITLVKAYLYAVATCY